MHTTQPVGCVRALGPSDGLRSKVAQHGSLREGNARGAQQPYACLRWRVPYLPWGVEVHARGQRPRCRAFGELRRSASMSVHASASNRLESHGLYVWSESPFWLCTKRGKRWVRGLWVGDRFVRRTNECTSIHSALLLGRSRAGTSSLDEYDGTDTAI